MRSIPHSWIDPYYAQVEGQEREPWSGCCMACRCKFFGEFAKSEHMKSPKHMMMVRKWHHACMSAGIDRPAVINFVA